MLMKFLFRSVFFSVVLLYAAVSASSVYAIFNAINHHVNVGGVAGAFANITWTDPSLKPVFVSRPTVG
jgi:hypothetical protein